MKSDNSCQFCVGSVTRFYGPRINKSVPECLEAVIEWPPFSLSCSRDNSGAQVYGSGLVPSEIVGDPSLSLRMTGLRLISRHPEAQPKDLPVVKERLCNSFAQCGVDRAGCRRQKEKEPIEFPLIQGKGIIRTGLDLK